MRLPRPLGALAPLLLLGACTASPAHDDETPTPSASPAPVLERAWSAAGWQTTPTTWNERWWLSANSTTSGVGRGTTWSPGPYTAGDAATGTVHPLRSIEGFACFDPVLPEGGSLVALVTTGPSDGLMLDSPRPKCTTLQVVDLATRREAWRAPIPATGETKGRLAVTGGVIHLTAGGRTWCWALESGDPLSAQRCSDVPQQRFLNAEGAPIGRNLGDEIGRSADVALFVLSRGPGDSEVRAHSLPDGRLLWTDHLDLDPLMPEYWRRDEAYALNTEGRLVRAHYEHADDPAKTVAVLSEVDPRTGTVGDEVGRVEGGLLLRLIGDVAVLAVDQEREMRSRMAGFVLPAAQQID